MVIMFYSLHLYVLLYNLKTKQLNIIFNLLYIFVTLLLYADLYLIDVIFLHYLLAVCFLENVQAVLHQSNKFYIKYNSNVLQNLKMFSAA